MVGSQWIKGQGMNLRVDEGADRIGFLHMMIPLLLLSRPQAWIAGVPASQALHRSKESDGCMINRIEKQSIDAKLFRRRRNIIPAMSITHKSPCKAIACAIKNQP